MQTHRGIYSRGYLHHIDLPNAIQHVCFHLTGSLPVDVQKTIRSRPAKERQAYADNALDRTAPRVSLRDYEADVVAASLQFFDNVRYDLIAWVVMPNHVHVCLQQREGWPLAHIIQSWKRHSSREVNRKRGRYGSTWERDYFDKVVRTEKQLAKEIAYIEGNPVKAGLVARPSEWRWSSAWNNRTKWPGA